MTDTPPDSLIDYLAARARGLQRLAALVLMIITEGGSGELSCTPIPSR